jgi:hypothetical protein
MDEASNKYALAALKERRAAIAGEISSLESCLRYLRQMVEHVDGTLREEDGIRRYPLCARRRRGRHENGGSHSIMNEKGDLGGYVLRNAHQSLVRTLPGIRNRCRRWLLARFAP